MTTRSRRFISQASGVALAAVFVASVPVQGARVAPPVQAPAQTSAPGTVTASQQAHVPSIGFSPNIYHHWGNP